MKPYKIYRNLRNKCFSVLKYDEEKKGYRLYAHVTKALLYNVVTKVSEPQRQRVIKDKQKNVHAFIMARYYLPIQEDRHIQPSQEIYYNPYQQNHFTIGKGGKPFQYSEFALLDNSKAFII